MLRRMFRSIVIMAALVIAWGVFTGFMVDSAAGALRGAFQGLVVAAAGAISFVIMTLDARTPLSRQYPALSQPDSVERQVFVASSSAAFVDMIGLALLSAALVMTYPELFNAAPLLIGIVVVALVDFGIRFGLQRRSLVGSA